MTVFIEYVDNSYGEGVSASQVEVLEAAGVNVVAQAHDGAATDVTDSVLAARQSDPDVWLITGYVPDSKPLLRTAEEQGFDPPATVLTGAGDSQETYEAVGGDALEGTVVIAYPHWTEDLIEVYRARFDEDPIDTVSLTAWSGDDRSPRAA
jgi:branched-chain amino acid transport system substrate-binding protein